MRSRSFSYACLLFAALCGAYFLVFFQRLSLGVIMPELSRELELAPSMTGWLGSAFLYAYAATQIPAGLMVDGWGPRRAMLLLFGLGGVGGILFASSSGLGQAIVGRALVGMGMAVVTTASFKIMSRWFSESVYARLVSIFMAVGGLGTFFAAAPLASLSASFGWRPVFWAIAVFSLLWGAVLFVLVKDAPSESQRRELGLPDSAFSSEHTAVPSKASRALEGFRVLFSSRQYRLIIVWYLTGASLFFSFAGLWAGDYYRSVHHLSPESTGALLSLGALSLIFGTPAGAWISGRIRSRKMVLVAGSLAALASSASLCFCSSEMPVWALWLQFGGICLAGNATASVLFTAVREALPPSVLGLSTSMLSFSMFACTACLQAAIGAVLERLAPLGTEAAYSRAFLIYLVFSVISLVAALMLRGKSRA